MLSSDQIRSDQIRSGEVREPKWVQWQMRWWDVMRSGVGWWEEIRIRRLEMLVCDYRFINFHFSNTPAFAYIPFPSLCLYKSMGHDYPINHVLCLSPPSGRPLCCSQCAYIVTPPSQYVYTITPPSLPLSLSPCVCCRCMLHAQKFEGGLWALVAVHPFVATLTAHVH
jgi:hypothetical protein